MGRVILEQIGVVPGLQEGRERIKVNVGSVDGSMCGPAANELPIAAGWRESIADLHVMNA